MLRGGVIIAVFVHPFHLLGIALEPCPHVGRHGFLGDLAAVGIAQDRGGAVVAAHHDETFLIVGIEDIVVGSITTG